MATTTTSCWQGYYNQDSNNKRPYTNALIRESSPDLLMHAHNPENWCPKGGDALQRAKNHFKRLLFKRRLFYDIAHQQLLEKGYLPLSYTSVLLWITKAPGSRD
jgi:hypothetical protein